MFLSGHDIPYAELPTEMYVCGPRYRIEFYAFEHLGGSIGRAEALARASFDIRKFTLDVKCIMPRDKLLEIVQKNKVQHEAMRKEAIAGWTAKATAACTQAVQQLAAGEVRAISIRMHPPEDHTLDYARAIKMLEMTTQAEIELDEHDFATLVDDDWEWTRSWVCSNRGFSKTLDSYGIDKGI